MLTYADVGSGGATRATHSDPWHGSHRAARADDELAAKLAAARQSCNRGATESPQSEEARDATDAADATHTDTDAADAQVKEQAVNGRALIGTHFACFTITNRYSGNSYLLY